MATIDASASDTITLTELFFVETSFNYDGISMADSVVASLTLGVVAQDSVSTTDVVTPGFVRWATLSDSVAITDAFSRQINYSLTVSDTISTSDVIHPWSIPNDQKLSATFQGDADLQAVLLKKDLTPPVAVTPPPRTVTLPRPPKVLIEHNVVNPNPPNRQIR